LKETDARRCKVVVKPHKKTKAIIRFFLLLIAAVGIARLFPHSETAGDAIFAIWFCALGAYTTLLSAIGIAKREPERETGY
jgi:hypothetical protein